LFFSAPQLTRDPLGVTGGPVRIPISLLASLLLIPPEKLCSQAALPPVATKGLELLVGGRPDSAVALWTKVWGSTEDAAKRDQLTVSFRSLPQLAGPILGYDLIRVVDVTPHLRRAYVLLRATKQPVYLLLVLYEAKDEWNVTTVNWHTDFDHVVPSNLFGPERPGP
jgi:hypothetical protein